MKTKKAGIRMKLPTAAFVSITIVATAACGQESSVRRDPPQLTGDAGGSPSLPIVSKKPSDDRTRLRGRFWRWLHPESPSRSGRENREAESVRDSESGHISRSVQPVRSPGEASSSRAVDLPLHRGNGPAMDRPIGGDSPGGKVDAEVSPTYFQDFLVSPETRSAIPGSQADLSFLDRLYQALFVEEPNPQEEGEAAQPRRLPPAPYQSPPFPFSEHLGPIIGIRDDAVWPLMEALEKGRNGDWWKENRIKIYGWIDPSVTFGTSRNSNIPEVYNIVPNSLQLSQAILIFERMTDSNQTDHMDWGFKVTNLYGIDYRYTTAKGWFSDQLLKHNRLYGWDPLQLYFDIYFPKVLDGMILRVGRYISPIDIEAQLSPENYLYTHSVMYSVDPYTFTGVQGIFRLNERFYFMTAIHAGNDMAPWTTSSQPNGEFLIKWVSKNNKDVLFGGVDSIGRGVYKNGHDDLQVSSLMWEHKFNDNFHTITEMYYIWQRNALTGGSVIEGPPESFFPSVGPGKLIPGLSDSLGFVNYTAYKLGDKDRLVLRSDILADFQGQRLGFKTTYFEHTLGWAHFFYDWLIFRPEVRLDYTSGAKAFDNGTKRNMFTFSADVIIRF
jgi:hypothetical protein